jgi:hypothetical protein
MNIGHAVLRNTSHVLRAPRPSDRLAVPPLGTETSALKYFCEIPRNVPSAWSAVIALFAWPRSAVSLLRKARTCSLVSSPAFPAISMSLDQVI